MRILITGANGMLGSDVTTELVRRNHDCVASGSSESYRGRTPADYMRLELSDPEAVDKSLEELHPQAVVHCAAWTDVEGAERPENYSSVRAINSQGTRNLAESCRKIGSKMLYVTTDYVFNGEGNLPYEADCKDFAPLNAYGKSKLEGELAVADIMEKYFIVRTQWMFGEYGANFVKNMLRIAQSRSEVSVVDNEIGTPTYSADLARLIADMVETDKYGYYNATNSGNYISWYDFTCEIFRQCGLDTKVIPISAELYGKCKAKRPHNSRLDKSKLAENGFTPLPEWKDALKRYLKILLNN